MILDPGAMELAEEFKKTIAITTCLSSEADHPYLTVGDLIAQNKLPSLH